MNSGTGIKKRIIADQSFWVIALVTFGVWKLVKWPIGWMAALTIGIYWLVKNRDFLLWWMQQLNCRLIFWLNGIQDHSMWFDQEGREKILALIERLSAEGKSYCNLAEELELPGYAHWYDISNGLNEYGIISQITTNSFYIMWKPAQQAA
mgnify:CR=1 FL=1